MNDGRVKVRNATRDRLLAERAELAMNPLRRAVGLIGCHDWSAADGLVIWPGNSVHAFFMRLPIDVVHVSGEGGVLRLISAMRPWRLGPIVRRSRWMLELPAGRLSLTGTRVGDHLDVED